MVEFKDLDKNDQKIVCELMHKMCNKEAFGLDDMNNLSMDGALYMEQVLKEHLVRLGYTE